MRTAVASRKKVPDAGGEGSEDGGGDKGGTRVLQAVTDFKKWEAKPSKRCKADSGEKLRAPLMRTRIRYDASAVSHHTVWAEAWPCM